MLFSLLYFSEGAPIGYVWWMLPAVLKSAGVPTGDVAWIVGTLVIPWATKFLWAPVVDALQGPRWSLKSWIILAQTLMGITLAPLLWLDLANEGQRQMAIILVIGHAFCAATQDVAVDALTIRTTHATERGSLNGWMQAGMLAGRALFGGAALLVAMHIGNAAVILSLIGCVWITMLLLIGCKMPAEAGAGALPGRATVGAHAAKVVRTLIRALSKRRIWLGIGFALVGGAAYEAAGVATAPMLLDKGLDESQLGWFNLLPRTIAMVAGGLLGGWISDRYGRRRTVGAFLCALAVLVAMSGWLYDEPGAWTRAGLIGVFSALYLFIGAFTASSYALFMDLADPEAGGTEFSAFTSATNMCEMWAAWAFAAALGARLDHATALGGLAIVSMGAWFILPHLPSSAPAGEVHDRA